VYSVVFPASWLLSRHWRLGEVGLIHSCFFWERFLFFPILVVGVYKSTVLRAGFFVWPGSNDKQRGPPGDTISHRESSILLTCLVLLPIHTPFPSLPHLDGLGVVAFLLSESTPPRRHSFHILLRIHRSNHNLQRPNPPWVTLSQRLSHSWQWLL
jgi:hypothetical protein